MGTRYDRQLRLWSLDGQQSLAAAHVVVLGATATAAELLKNLILPGIGFFTIVDDALVNDEAMGNNFFVTIDDYKAGLPLAKAMLRHLGELNMRTSGMACVESCVSWTEAFLSRSKLAFDTDLVERKRQLPTLIVATPRLPEASLRHLAACLKRERGPPLMYVQTLGFAGLIHVQESERFIIYSETKPEVRVADLRIFNPFSELREWFDAHNPGDKTLLSENLQQHNHLPWIAILYYALQRVRLERGTPEFVPCSKEDYDVLRRAVVALIGHSHQPQESFMEAMERCCTVLNRPSFLPANVQEILRDPRADAPRVKRGLSDRNESLCWAVVHGIRRFIEEHNGVPPFCGHVPDFTATTQSYCELRAIYERKMNEDCVAVSRYAIEALEKGGDRSDNNSPVVDMGEISALARAFVENIWTIQLVRFYPDLDEITTEKLHWRRFSQYFSECSTEEERFTVELYAAVLASRGFEEQNGRPPGYAPNHSAGEDATWKDDAKELLHIIEKSRQGLSDVSDLTIKACMEVGRCGAGEPATVACIVGAAAAQECIKLVQHRRIPIQQPLIFDGYRSCFWLSPPLSESECGT